MYLSGFLLLVLSYFDMVYVCCVPMCTRTGKSITMHSFPKNAMVITKFKTSLHAISALTTSSLNVIIIVDVPNYSFMSNGYENFLKKKKGIITKFWFILLQFWVLNFFLPYFISLRYFVTFLAIFYFGS